LQPLQDDRGVEAAGIGEHDLLYVFGILRPVVWNFGVIGGLLLPLASRAILAPQNRTLPVAKIDFFYEFASTYSYPAAMRIDDLALDYDVEVNWRPFLLGPIFKAQGWETSPFNIYPEKGRYMRRDLERICEAHGLPNSKCRRPFRRYSILPARVALCFTGELRAAFSRAVYDAEFAGGADISDTKVIEKFSECSAKTPRNYSRR
jgi:2-hydroxychromene-2-carboxylate isomerase